MSPYPTAHPSGVAARPLRALVALVVALTFASAGCGSSEPKTQVLGEQENQGAADEVVLLEAVCITNTPTREPC